MKNINGIKFIGDLSIQDVDVLIKYAKKSKSLLEFGVGGSTQIISQCSLSNLVSIETDPSWIEITRKRLHKLKTESRVHFYTYDEANSVLNANFDFIFVDGVDNLRLEFAYNTWKLLNIGGVMLFHDTRRLHDFANVMSLCQAVHNEVELIEVNAKAEDGVSSNITIVHKKKHEPYVNWNEVEGKEGWATGSIMDSDLPFWTCV